VSLGVIGLGYAGIGVVTAIAIAATRGLPTIVDAFLAVAMWPLWAPLAMVRESKDAREQELLGALSRAQGSPLASVLPDAESARVLASRLREASQRLGELDEVLARPDFDPAVVKARAADLRGRGAVTAAATAELRAKTIGQLRALRERYNSDLQEVGELIAQLVTQAELVRLQPQCAQASSELVRELVSRVEGLDDLFAYQLAIESGQEYQPVLGRSTSA